MSATQPDASGPAGLTIQLGSNNPFRRTASPGSVSSPPPLSPFDDPPPRPTSTNPFLDPSALGAQRGPSPDKMASPPKSPTAEEIFGNLQLDDSLKNEKKPSSPPVNGGARPPPPPGSRPPRPPGPPGASRGRGGPPRGGRGGARPPPPSHRPSASQEEAMKARRMQPLKDGEKKPPGSPQSRPRRRNSESSVIGIETDEEKKAKERRRRERERRAREGGGEKKPSKRIDIIDQLDATSVYGSGLFHHDGPFDACNPHRNRKGSRRAPMHAFAKDSLNNSLGGAGPLNKRQDHATFMGHHDDQGYKDYATGANGNGRPGYKGTEQGFFDPKGRDEVLHGDESMGLGTSTFLEGAPAARSAIQRRQEEQFQDKAEEGLQRKKSLAHRIRNINRAPPPPPGRSLTSDSNYGPRSNDITASSNGEANPFFNEFDKQEDVITVKRKDSNPATPGSPQGAPLERRATTDATAALSSSPEGSSKPQGNGFLSRVKSLKGGRRQRPEIPAAATPGTAA